MLILSQFWKPDVVDVDEDENVGRDGIDEGGDELFGRSQEPIGGLGTKALGFVSIEPHVGLFVGEERQLLVVEADESDLLL